MSWTVSPFSVVIFGSGIVSLVVGIAALRKRPDPNAWPLALAMFAVTAWAVPHAISLGVSEVRWVAFWHRMRYPGTVAAPVLYLVVTLRYAGYERWLSRRVCAGLAIVPVLTVIVVWTNQYHGLFWQSLSVARVGDASVFVPSFGPWYWVNLGYLYLVTALSLATLSGVVVRSSRLYRKQAGLMFVGGAIPLAVNGVTNFGGSTPGIDFTTTALAVSGVTFALALFYLDLLELRPVARSRLVEELDDGVIVVGPDERIQDFNPTASRVLGDIAVGQPVEDVLSTTVVADGGELTVERGGRTRQFRTRSTSLTDDRGRTVGRIVYLNDVTDVVEREQRISVLNRVLRHNVRNELNIAAGRLELVDEEASPEAAEHVETATEAIDRVTEIAEKARHVERTLQGDDTADVVSLASTVRRVVTDAREAYPDAVVDASATPADGAASVRVVDADLLEMALGELVENAIVHNAAETPHVTVRVDVGDERTRVTVADDGPGIPESVTEVLNERTETALRHGDGLGLWLVTWTASLSAGDLSFERNDPRGSVVTLSLQTADDESRER